MDATLEGRALTDWLLGTWSVERDINAGAGSFRGEAVFERQPDGTLRWHEAGEMQLGSGAPLPVTRTLTLDDDGQVRFDDGRLFHELRLSDGAADAFHPCGPDDYTGHYAITGDNTFVVTWNVAGPGRADTLHSTYTRRHPAG